MKYLNKLQGGVVFSNTPKPPEDEKKPEEVKKPQLTINTNTDEEDDEKKDPIKRLRKLVKTSKKKRV
jgi:hypothetical protein